MARQNYGFNKRQREIAKKQKREEKLQRRQERKAATPDGGDAAPPEEGLQPGEGADDAASEDTEPMEIRIEEAP